MKRLTYFLFGLLLFSSCEQDAFFIVNDGHTKIHAFSEITTDRPIKVVVNIAPGINTEDEYFRPKQKDALVQLTQDGVVLDNPGFRYISGEKAFISQGAFRPEAGVEYGLTVSMKNETELDAISGTTTIPDFYYLEDIRVQAYRTEGLANQKMDFEVEVSFPLVESENRFLLLKPQFVNVDGEMEDLLIGEIDPTSEGLYYSTFNKGLLVDLDLAADELDLTLINEFQVSNDLDLTEINIDVKTITADAYNYYKSFSKQVASQSVSLSEPVITYSNFENGLGLFTGFSKTVNTAKIY